MSLDMNPKPQKLHVCWAAQTFELWLCKNHLPEFLGWQNEKKNVGLSSCEESQKVSHGLSPKENCQCMISPSIWRQTPYRRQSIKTYHLRTGVVVCLKMVLRWSHWKNISWSDKLNRLGHFTKLPWDLEVFSQSVESWRMFGFKLVRTGCGTLKIQFRWKLNCRSKCLELPRRNLRRKFSHDRTK